jgi:cytoskeleton protein RodZ
MDESAPVSEAAKSGNILQAERERQGLTVDAVAERLRMRPYQIEALEAGDFSKLPQGTFLRGFMKNYARLLGIEPDRILAALEEQVPKVATNPGIVVPSQNIRYRTDGPIAMSRGVKLLLAGVLVLGAGLAFAYWWIDGGRGSTTFSRWWDTGTTVRASQPPPPAKSNTESAKAVSATAAPVIGVPASAADPTNVTANPTVGQPAPATTPSMASDGKPSPVENGQPVSGVLAGGVHAGGVSAGGVNAAASSAPVAPAPTQTTAASAGDGNTRFNFAGKSWVQIKDARGRVIHQREHDTGSSFALDVPPGASLIIGNSKSVRLQRNGREIDLAPHTDVNVARLRAE